MSFHHQSSGPRGRQYDNHGIPDYDVRDTYGHPPLVGSSQQPRNNMRYGNATEHQQRQNRHIHPQNPYGGYNYPDPHHQGRPLQPPRSHFAPPSSRQRGGYHGPPPDRPPRTDYQLPYDAPPLPSGNHSPYNASPQHSQYHGDGQWADDRYNYPVEPHHSNPQQQPPVSVLQSLVNSALRRPPLGPPPSSRRGPSSYYPELPAVHPIVEETDSAKGSIRSYGSSNAIPIGVPSYYLEDRESMYSEVPSIPALPRDFEDSDAAHFDGRQSRFEDRSESPSNIPVRQASMGKRTKPTLTTVKSSDRSKRDTASPATSGFSTPHRPGFPFAGSAEGKSRTRPPPSTMPGKVAQPAATAVAVADAQDLPSKDRPLYDVSNSGSSDVLGSNAGILDISSSDSEKETDSTTAKRGLAAAPYSTRSKSPLLPVRDALEKEVLGVSPARNNHQTLKPPGPGFSDRLGKRRPPRINVDAVKDAEQRGSLTSLPDLIKRATKLASNLDRGRTASRLGMHSWLNVSGDLNEKRRSQNSSVNNRRSAASITDMLASFPPPAIGTPTGSRADSGRSITNFSRLRHSIALHSNSDDGDEVSQMAKRKRCCGMPLWVLILLLIAAICLIAAAIVIPVVLIVIPQQRNASVGNTALSNCQSQLTCQNGGANVLASNGSCSCICTNGYTGPTCSVQADAGCTTFAVASANNATVGNSIPRLVNDAKTNFSIPLDASTLLGIFSSASLSCSSENALVTFSNLAERDVSTPTLIRRVTDTTSSANAVATSNGIVFQEGTPSTTHAASVTSSASSTTSSTASSTSTASTTPASSSSATSSANSTTLDFARTAVLYILQSSGQLNNAITAQQNLQDYFQSQSGGSGSSNATGLDIGNGAVANLVGYTIKLANGTSVGGSSRS